MKRVHVKSGVCLASAAAWMLAADAEIIRSGEAVLGLSDRNGAVEQVRGADGVARAVASGEAFTLQLRDGDGSPVLLKSTDFSFTREGRRMEWRHANGLRVSMEVAAADGEFRFRPSVEGIPSGKLLEWFDGPQVCVAADAKLFWPYVDGMEVTDTGLRRGGYRPVGFRSRGWRGGYTLYPHYCQMQCLASYKDGKGLYYSAVDDRHTPKDVDWERVDDGTVRLSLMTFCGDLDKDGAWRPSFHYVLRPFEGDWMDACAMYRDWVHTLPDFARPPSRPKWMYDSPVNLIYPVRGEGLDRGRPMNPNRYFPYMNAMSAVEKYGNLLDSRIMALLMHWEGTAPWAPPYVWPPYGGEEALAKFRDALHARGDLLGVYCSGTAWTQISSIDPSYSLEQRFEDERLGRYMIRGPKGEITAGCCNGYDTQRLGYEMCLAADWSVRTVCDEIAKMSRFGIDYCQFFDQNFGGGWHLCYSRKHNHPPIPGAWATAAMTALQKKVAAAPAGKMLLGCEGAAATPYVPQLYYNDARSVWAFRRAGMGGAKPVPGTSFVFHEWMCNFSGNMCASGDVDPVWRWTYSFHCGDMFSLVLGPDDGLVAGWGRSWDRKFPGQDKLVPVVKRFNALRKKHPSFLLEGKMVKPFLQCRSRDAEFAVLKEHAVSVKMPEVSVSFWENAKGERIGFATNWRTEPSELRIRRSGGAEETMRLDPFETVELHE